MRFFVVLVVLVVITFVLFVAWATAPWDAAREGIEIRGEGVDPPPLDLATVVTYNVHFGFGPDESPKSRAEVVGFLDTIAQAIVTSNADIVCLQEVDFDCGRSHGIDMVAHLAEKTGLSYAATATTWNLKLLPYPYWPPGDWFGHMLSGQAVLSRFPIVDQEVVPLPDPDSNSWLYGMFYLHHVVQAVTVDFGDRTLMVINVHLEAFENEARQEGAVITAELVKDLAHEATIVAGDFNSVPPEATLKHAFPDEPETDMRQDIVIDTMRSDTHLVEVLGNDIYTTDEPASFTFPAHEPNRRLDYIFVTDGAFRVIDAHVMGDVIASDHLPVVARLSLTD